MRIWTSSPFEISPMAGPSSDLPPIVCCHCGVPWPGNDKITADDLLDGKPDLPVCIKSPGKDRWLKDSGINGHMFRYRR